MHSSLKFITDLKSKLSDLHKKDEVTLVSNATIGLSLALISAGIKDKRVAIPNNVCINVPMAVLFSGNEPIYLDISESDMGLDPKILARYIDEVDAVIAVHAYGIPCQIKTIQELCRNNGKLLIEDFCVAQGAAIDEEPLGSFGDISIVSFGSGKIIDVGHGGAILSDNLYLMNEIHCLLRNLPICDLSDKKRIEDFSDYHTDLYNHYYGSSINQYYEDFIKRAMEVRMSYFHQYDNSYTDLILKALSNLDENIESRRRKSEDFQEIFSNQASPHIKIFDYPDGSVYWRYNLFVQQNRDELLHHLLQKEYKISSWQPSANYFFSNRDAPRPKTPVSDRVGDTILNLWVNKEVGKNYANQISSEINSFLN